MLIDFCACAHYCQRGASWRWASKTAAPVALPGAGGKLWLGTLLKMSISLEGGFLLGGEGFVGAVKVLRCMQSACACASASMACSSVIDHSWCSMALVMLWAKVGPWASLVPAPGRASSWAAVDQGVVKAPGQAPRRSWRDR